ncbi:mRNA capping enzyme alpha subunit [Rhizophagus clarus]|uniref:mRNA capping enzyme alpha subunit n=1 Tax=Rhizophagus clarus TaxID=94130 RepID=A0A8H3KZX5_9GLOM|nr:mRNA capping enzyme alpha subunit [Rhizophagus clarus]
MAYSLNQRPDKIGVRLDDKYANSLSLRIKELLRHNEEGFPGSQPVHFESRNFELLEKENYYVRDKTDGKRYIMFFTAVDGGTAFMMDESCQFRTLAGFKLPLRSNPNHMHNETMMDGEVIIDTNNNEKCLRYLIFDLMVLNGNTLIEKPYNKRMGMLKFDVLEPLNAELEKNVGMKKNLPLTFEIKPMELSYGLKCGNDSLVFVPVNHPYESGICKKLLLWKPTTKLTVDFMIRVQRFKEETYQLFILDGKEHRFYDYLTLDSDIAFQWQRNSPDGNIATFWYDKHWKKTIPHDGTHDGGWRFIRFVRDKNKADREKDVDRVWKCIQNSVPPEMLENRKPIIRENWKRRQSTQFPDTQPLPSPISQIQTPSINSTFESVSPSIPSNIYFYNNNNTQLVSPSISSSESFAFLKERRSSEEQTRDQNNKNATYFSYNSNDVNHENFKRKTSNDRSYFPPVYGSRSPDQTGLSRPNVKPKDSQNSSSQVFEPPVQEMKLLDQRASTRPSVDTTSLDNSMILPKKNRSEKRSADIQYFHNDDDDPMKDLMEIGEEIIKSGLSPKTSPTLDRDHSLLKSNKLIRNDIINHSSNEKASRNEPDYESNDDEVLEQVSSDDDLSRREHHRTLISSDSNRNLNNLNKQDNNYQRVEQEPNFKKEESSIEDDLWDQPEPNESPMSTKSQNNSPEDYWAEKVVNKNEKKDDVLGENADSIEENIHLGRNISSPKLTKLPIFEQSQFHQDVSPRELSTSIPVQDMQIFQQQQQQQQKSPWEKYIVTDNSSENTQPLKQIQSKSPLEQDNRLIPERLQNGLPNNGNNFSNPLLQLPNNDQVASHKGIRGNQETSFHSSVSLDKIQTNIFKNRPEPLQLQTNMLATMESQALPQENKKAPYNDFQHATTQMKSSIPRDQIQENNISTTSSLQQYKVPDNQSDSTRIHVPNQKTRSISVQSQPSLQSINRFTNMETRQLFPQTQDIQRIPSTNKVTLQNNVQESQQNIALTKPKLSESRQETSRQESRSTIIFQQPRRQTISDSRSIVTSQPRQIHTSQYVPVQIRAPLQENRLMNPPQTQTQLMDSRSIFQSQVTTQETRQIQQEYQQISNSQYIDKQKDLNMEQERLNHNNPNFQQAFKPMPRRHTLSSTNNPLYQQNFSDPYHERQYSMMVSSYPPPRQEISSSGISFTSRCMSPPQQNLSPSTTSQELNTLSQIPEEHSHNNSNLKFADFMHNPSQELSQTTQQIQQNVKNVITNSNIPPVLRPSPQKRKSKGALDFILNTGGGSSLKRSKYDNEDNDAN